MVAGVLTCRWLSNVAGLKSACRVPCPASQTAMEVAPPLLEIYRQAQEFC